LNDQLNVAVRGLKEPAQLVDTFPVVRRIKEFVREVSRCRVRKPSPSHKGRLGPLAVLDAMLGGAAGGVRAER
jgi:hypothetical protein